MSTCFCLKIDQDCKTCKADQYDAYIDSLVEKYRAKKAAEQKTTNG